MIDKFTLQAAVKEYLLQNRIGQTELAQLAGVSQTVVSRSIHRNWKNYIGAMKRLGDFIQAKQRSIDPRESEALMQALGSLWDGTKEGEESLVNFLASVKGLGVKA